MTTRTKAARGSCHYARAKALHRFAHATGIQIIPSDLALAVIGAALWLGVPFILALLKQMGAW